MRLVRELQPAMPTIAMSGRPVTPDPRSEPGLLATASQFCAVRSLPAFKPAALPATLAECLASASERPPEPTPDSNAASCR